MARADDLIFVGATGIASVAPLGSTAPTTASDALDAAFTDLGGITTDGLEEAFGDTITNESAWGSKGPVLSLFSSSERTFKVTCKETNAKVLEVYLRQAAALVPATGVITVNDDEGGGLVYYAGVFDVVMNTTNLARFYFSKIALTGRDSITYKEDGSANYPMTFTAYPDATGKIGTRWYSLAGLA